MPRAMAAGPLGAHRLSALRRVVQYAPVVDRRYSAHALEAMAEHGVADANVAAILSAPRYRRR